jgi:VanZ family protein
MAPALKHSLVWRTVGWLMVACVVIGSLVPAGTPGLGLINDKLEHGGGYAALTIWFIGVYPRQRHWVIVAAFIAMGIVIELLQGWMKLGRECDIRDVFANTTGIIIGLLIARLWLRNWPARAEAWIAAR